MQVQVTQTLNNSETPQLIRNLKKGDYFGEKALLRLVLDK
jgi:CRP-like cAMP-binding protein